jgi:hypothetical protein
MAKIRPGRHKPIAFAVALLAVLAAALWGCGGSSSSPPTPGEPEIVSAGELSEFAAELDHPIYWVGEREDTSLELTETKNGNVYVRYLTEGAEAGDDRPNFLTVGTYASDNAVAALREAGQEKEEAQLGRTSDGAVLLVDKSAPDSAHFAYPDSNLEIEIYSPKPGDALRLAIKGDAVPVP